MNDIIYVYTYTVYIYIYGDLFKELVVSDTSSMKIFWAWYGGIKHIMLRKGERKGSYPYRK